MVLTYSRLNNGSVMSWGGLYSLALSNTNPSTQQNWRPSSQRSSGGNSTAASSAEHSWAQEAEDIQPGALFALPIDPSSPHLLLLHHHLAHCCLCQGQEQTAAHHPLCREGNWPQSAIPPGPLHLQDPEASGGAWIQTLTTPGAVLPRITPRFHLVHGWSIWGKTLKLEKSFL